MIREIAADLRIMLPRSVRVLVADGHLYLTHKGQTLRLSSAQGEALLRQLPAVPGRASERLIETRMAHPTRRIRVALRSLQPTRVPP